MAKRPPLKIDGEEYLLSHLDNKVFTYSRKGNEDVPDREIKFLFSFSDHCFTDHYGDESHSYNGRYFCKKRYTLSLELPELLKQIIKTNSYLLMTFVQHREQFFYVEQNFQNETYRVFLEIHQLRDNESGVVEGVRIDVRSAYDEKPHANAVTGSNHLKIWRIIDARMSGVQLPRKRRKR